MDTRLEEVKEELMATGSYDDASDYGKGNLLSLFEKAFSLGQQSGREETEKAFGGCKNCYGKGYSSEQEGVHSTGRGIVRGPRKSYKPCPKCERGHQFEEVLEAARTNKEGS